MKLIKAFRKFEHWFDLRFGWFFTNGNKMDARNKRLKKHLTKNK